MPVVKGMRDKFKLWHLAFFLMLYFSDRSVEYASDPYLVTNGARTKLGPLLQAQHEFLIE